jgi:hypothetical protein
MKDLVPLSKRMLATRLLMLPVLMIFSILVAERAFSTSKEAAPMSLAIRSKGTVVIKSFKKLKEMK